MSVVALVAPPKGWQKWPASRTEQWFTTARTARKKLSPSGTFAYFRCTIVFALEQGKKGKRFPALDKLNFDAKFLEAGDVRKLLKELDVISRELRNLPVDRIISPRVIIESLDFNKSFQDLIRQEKLAWKRVWLGTLKLPTLDSDEIDLLRKEFAIQHPRRTLWTAGEAFGPIIQGLRLIARRAILERRGLIVN